MALQSCSIGARGLWIDMMCIAHECEPYGHLTVNGRPMTASQIARHVGVSQRDCERLLRELEDSGVSSSTPEGTIFSRRMVRDERTRNLRAEGGKAGSVHGIKGAEHGSKGGRPAKPRGVFKPPLEPPPSSSSSSSSSKNTPQPPNGGLTRKTPLVSLKAWAEATKAKGEKLIPDGDPVFAYAEQAGIPAEYLDLAWLAFRRCYTVQYPDKRYADWRRVFRNCVEGNWLKLWYADKDGRYGLTTVGIQARQATQEAA